MGWDNIAGSDDADKTQILRIQRNQYLELDYIACHAVAAQLQEIMGVRSESEFSMVEKPELDRDGGLSNRAAAAQRGAALLKGTDPCIITVKATAEVDGHSFSLVASKDRVDVMEVWAQSGGEVADLVNLANRLKVGLTREQAARALLCLGSHDPKIRDQGFDALSIAYPGEGSLKFELKNNARPIEDCQTELAAAERAGDKKQVRFLRERIEKLGKERAEDGHICLQVITRALKSDQDIKAEMDRRLDLVARFKQDLQRLEPDAAAAQPQVGSVRNASAAELDSGMSMRSTRARPASN